MTIEGAMTAEEMVAAYVACWNTPEDAARRELFERCWADGGVYLDPATVMSGRGELAAGCRRFADRSPGARIEVVGGIVAHHGHASFAWCVRDAAGAVLREGFDHVEFAADGRIRRVVGYSGSLPWPAG